MEKRGVSPLIATVLLVGLTVSVVTVVFIFGKDTVKETSQDLSEEVSATSLCNDIEFRVQGYNCETPANGEVDDLTILNMVEFKIEGFRVVDGGGESVEYGQLLSSFGSIIIDVSAQEILSGEVKVVPLVAEGRDFKGCGNKIQTIKVTC